MRFWSLSLLAAWLMFLPLAVSAPAENGDQPGNFGAAELSWRPNDPNGVALVAAEMDALRQAGKKAAAAALARDQWKRIATAACPEEHRSHFVRSAYEAFAQSDDPAEAVEFLMDVLSRVPQQLTENQRSHAFDALIAELVRAKRTEEALGWAKVHFMVCPFEEEAVQGALKNLQKAYLARPEGLKEWAAFVYAQQNRFRDNPLVGVPPPKLTPGQRAELLANAGQAATARVSALLLLGDCEAALEVAQQFLLASGGTREAVDNVCRCLKAQDLRLERANQFIQFLKWGRLPSGSDKGFRPIDGPRGKVGRVSGESRGQGYGSMREKDGCRDGRFHGGGGSP